MAKWTKGTYVYLKNLDGTARTSCKYVIRSIGDKQAVLDRSEYIDKGYKRKGTTIYKHTQEDIDVYLENNGGFTIPSYMKLDWSSVLIPCGNDNWDAEENYYS